MLGLSIREFAKRDGCSSTLVKRGKDRGTIKVLADGSLDPVCVGTDWRRAQQRQVRPGGVHKGAVHAAEGSHAASVDSEAAENAREALAALGAPDGVFESWADADKARVSFIAHLRRLEYEKARGQVIEITKVAQAWEEDFGQVRNALVAMPSAWAPQLHRCKTVVEVQDLLMRLITEALEALSNGRAAKLLG